MAEKRDNPYQAPVAADVGAGAEDPGSQGVSLEHLRAVARYQKWIQFVILAYFAIVALSFFIQNDGQGQVGPGQPAPAQSVILGPIVIVIGLTGLVCVFLLGQRLYSTVLAVVLAIGAAIPCVGLLFLLIVNSKATKTLKQNNIRVGLLGARMSDIK